MDLRRSRSRSRERDGAAPFPPQPFVGGMSAQQIANLPLFVAAGGVSMKKSFIGRDRYCVV